MANNYFSMLQAVENYYGAGSDQWVTMANWTGYRSTEVANILKQTPGVNVITNEAGELLSYSLDSSASVMTATEATAATAANTINSNALTAEAVRESILVPANVKAGQAAGTVEIASGASKVSTGSKVATAAGHVGTWLLGAGVGMKCGVWIDAGLYESGLAELWDPENAWAYNPENWKDHKVTNWLYDYSGYDDFQALFNADDEQMYVDENLFALMAQYLSGIGAFEARVPYCTRSDEQSYDLFYWPQYVNRQWNFYRNNCEFDFGWVGHIAYTAYNNTDPVYIILSSISETGSNTYSYFAFSKADFDITGSWSDKNYRTTRAGDSICYRYGNGGAGGAASITGGHFNYVPEELRYDHNFYFNDIPILIYHGIVGTGGGVEGINSYGQMPTGITPQMTPQQIIDLLKQQYPNMWDDAIKQGTLNDDGTITDRVYIPIALPTGGETGKPTTDPNHPGAVDPTNPTQTETVIKIVQRTPNPTPDPPEPNTGTGSTPTVVPPTGSADALYKIYNPTNAQIQSFGAWLWSSNFVDQLLKVFNDPMQAIISLHKIYATPHTGGNANIRVGYLDSGVSSKWVDEQYITVDCGTVSLYEKRASILDYDPFTDVRLYLPFIGIVKLDTADVMRGKINVKYNVDVITGTVVAMVNVTRDGTAGGVVYQYTGNMAEVYPLSSGSYMGIITGVLGIAAGVVGTIASGGAAAPAIIGGAAGLTAMHTRVEHSNGFSGNAGAMACKKPYLIISRQQSAMSNNLGNLTGWPSNEYVKLSQCSGYTRIKDINLSVSGATDTELQEIERLLKTGVII